MFSSKKKPANLMVEIKILIRRKKSRHAKNPLRGNPPLKPFGMREVSDGDSPVARDRYSKVLVFIPFKSASGITVSLDVFICTILEFVRAISKSASFSSYLLIV